MRWLIVIAAAGCVTIGAVIFAWPVQRVGSEPIRYGRDTCAHCRMHLSQPGFAGELRDANGVLTKYDDIGCLLQAMVGMHREIPEAWVEDHDGGGFIPLLGASLVRTDGLETPMGYGIVAFRAQAAAQAFAQSQRAQLVTLEEVLSNPARLVPAHKRGNAPTGREVGS